MRDHALEYARNGWPVFPLAPGGKRPLTPRGLHEATTEPLTIDQWWEKWPTANIGVATGEGLCAWVLDIDGEEGAASLEALEGELGEQLISLEACTGGGGRHIFFAWPEGHEIRNRQSVRPGLDVRGNGGYVVVAPSIHESGGVYRWPMGWHGVIDPAPPALLDIVAPPKRKVMPWERLSPPSTPRAPQSESAVMARARAYVRSCPAAVQGSGGHNALLWAARCAVVGYQLDDAAALRILWEEFNPRCSPPWDRECKSDRRDFERKVRQARELTFDKPPGWLLADSPATAEDDRLLEQGRASAAALLAKAEWAVSGKPLDPEQEEARREFPAEHFPPAIESYCRQVADAHDVDLSFATLPVLVVAGAAMGNVWRLRLKKRFVVPPIVWGAIVAVSGSNKSGPLSEVTSPLHRPPPTDNIGPMSPAGKSYTGDVTIESLIALMRRNPRGLLIYRDELKAWLGSFDKYRKGPGADEQTWLEMWGGGAYQLNRKTDDEDVFLPSASCSVLGGIQPAVLRSCFDAAKFASGLAPRLLMTCPPERRRGWSEAEVGDEQIALWENVVNWLRTQPFRSLRTQTISGSIEFEPHVLRLSAEAQARYAEFADDCGHVQYEVKDENVKGLIAKNTNYAGRLALIHHGLLLACDGEADFEREVGLASVEAGVSWAQWFLDEQLRLYGHGNAINRREQAEYLAERIREKHPAGIVSARQVQRLNGYRYDRVRKAITAMRQLVNEGGAEWANEQRTKIRLLKSEEAAA